MSLKKNQLESKANCVVLALSLAPHTYKELIELLSGGLDMNNPLHAEIAFNRPQQAIKQARARGHRIMLCGVTKRYWLKTRRA